MRFIVLFLSCVLSAGYAANADGQAFAAWDGTAQFRDAALDGSQHRLYAAAYDQNQVWGLDTVTGKRVCEINTGQGPCAVAVSQNGALLACANRLDNSVSLIRLSDNTLVKTSPAGDGPSSIASLSDGTFAAVNTYSDSISIIDSSGNVTDTVKTASSVPTDVAVSGKCVAVIGKTEPAVCLYPDGLAGDFKKVILSAQPVSVAALSDNRFVVATAKGLAIVSSGSKNIVRETPGDFLDVCTAENRIWALTATQLEEFSDALALVTKAAAPKGARRIAASGSLCAVLAPAEKAGYFIQPAASAPEQTAVAAPQAVEPASSTPVVVEAKDDKSEPAPQQPASEPQSSPAPAEETRPAEQPVAESEKESSPAPEMASSSQASDENVHQEPAESEQENPAPQAGKVYRYAPPIHTRAPRPGKPSASPLDELSKQTITDAVLKPTEFGAMGSGFIAPDWTQPFRDIQAGKMHQNLDTGRTDLEDNVHLRLGDMYFQADKFSYTEDAGEMHATGNVKIEQQDSFIKAQEIQYDAPPANELPPPSIFEPALDEQAKAKQRLTLGRVYAQQIQVSEPTRALSAEIIDYDFANEKGELVNAKGQAGIYYFYAKKLRILGPNSMEGEDVWITTCDHDPPHYRLRLKSMEIKDGVVSGGTNIRLQLGKVSTPLFLPVYRRGSSEHPWNVDFDSGREAEIGSFLNVGTRFELNPYVGLGPRIMPTSKEGVGIGADLDYDYMENPASWLYRTKGDIHGLYTTEDRGYLHLYHRYAPSEDLTVKAQVEHWGDQDFYKDFFYEQYRDRTTPRTFANITYRQPEYIATGTVRVGTHGWVHETERLPEATFHLLERPLTKNLYFTFDTVNGFNRREPSDEDAARSVNVARLTYDWDPFPALNVTPFAETQLAWYTDQRDEGGSTGRALGTVGTTLQTRLHREYEGFWGFSAFKHLILPSITYSYSPGSSMDVEDTPHFDALDTVWGRSRIETKIDNVVYGRDAETGQVWQVGRLTLYQGNDFWNETRKSDDYEVEIDVRPRPWWGLQLAGERHVINNDLNLDTPYFAQQAFYEWYDRAFGRPFDAKWMYDFNATYGDYSRVLTQLYYDDTAAGGRLNGRIGYAYTETQNRVFNKGILYGLGYKLGEKWGLGFEHIYDFEDDRLRQQTYELRRNLHCWEAAIRWRERESGTDINLEFSISAFPGSRLKL